MNKWQVITNDRIINSEYVMADYCTLQDGVLLFWNRARSQPSLYSGGVLQRDILVRGIIKWIDVKLIKDE